MNELKEIEDEIRSCKKCPLHLSRKNAVPGEGGISSGVMFVGEAPGYNEDIQGRPFVGAAGKLLTELIERVLGFKRSEVYITNVVKCRPPNNRDPEESEIEICSQYLERQIKAIRPSIVISLGRHSTLYFLSKAGVKARGIMSVRGKPYKVRVSGIPFTLFPTIHPAAALYNPNQRSIIEEDFKRIRNLLGGITRFF